MFYNGCGRVVIAYVNLKRYEFTCSDDRLEYYFDSVGPNGVIREIVKFQLHKNFDVIYNLAFGDVDVVTAEMNDFAKSNNDDREMIMATVAATVLEFLKSYPGKKVYAKGSKTARTQLYQMAIASNFSEISLIFDVFGYLDTERQPFKMNTNYNEFFVRRK